MRRSNLMVHYDGITGYGMKRHYEALVRNIPPQPPAPPKESRMERTIWIVFLILAYIALGIGTAIRFVFPPRFWHEKVEEGQRHVRAV